MIYLVTNIDWDCDDDDNLPQSLVVDVDENLDDFEKLEFISNEISELTGFCHFSFVTHPEIF